MRLLSLSIKTLEKGFRLLGNFFIIVWKITNPVFGFISNLIFHPTIGRYLVIKNKLSKKTSDWRGKIALFFTNRYIVHIIIIVLMIGVTGSNINAYENRDDYGQGALIYRLVGVENYDTGNDVITTSEQATPHSYTEDTAQLYSKLYTESQEQEEKIYREQYQNELATTQGGSALLKPDLANTEAAKQTRNSIQEYTVENNDTIGLIASKFNISVNTILWANNLTVQSFIKPGQKLIIPPTSGVIHKVVSGDTITKLASKYDADVARIIDFNDLDKNAGLIAGDLLIIPDGRIIYTAKPRSTQSLVTVTLPVSTPSSSSSGGKMLWPSSCRYISQYYRGWIHTGLDIACNLGTNIYAADTGVVSVAQYNRGGYGYYVIINHDDGKQTLYGHLSRILVEPGQTVARGQVIGLEGSTGRSTGPHLHFEVRIGGSRLNPLNYIR